MTTTSTNWSDLADEIDELTASDQEFAPRPEIDVRLADGGYLSWLYGSAEIRHAAWPPKFVGEKPIIVMDSRSILNRKRRNPGYKAGREQKRDNDPNWKDRTAMVHHFREMVEEEDGRFRFVRIEGLEADDLVALGVWSLQGKTLDVMGIDKDFLQLDRGIRLIDKDNIAVDYERFQKRLPLALQSPRIKHGWQILITLALMGDKSDSIPRILAARTPGLSFMQALLLDQPRRAFLQAYSEYGQKFLANLYDVILPDPEVLGFTPGDVFDALTSKSWGPHLFSRVLPQYRKEVDTWKLSPSKISRKRSRKLQTQ